MNREFNTNGVKMWYQKSKKRLLLDLHFPEWDKGILSNFNAKEIIDDFVKAGADTAIFFAKGHNGNSYYNTKIGHKHKNLGNKDIFGECVQEAKKKGLWVLAQYSLLWDNYVADKYPEWRSLTHQGIPAKGQCWSFICCNSRYQDYAVEQLREIAQGYEIDGFWLDILNYSSLERTCYCDNCKRLFKAKTGKDIPSTATWDKTWKDFLEFRYNQVEKLAKRIRKEILRIRPDISIIFNYAGYPAFSWPAGQRPIQHSQYSDYGTGEIYPYFTGYIYPSLTARFIRGVSQNKPFEILTSVFNRLTDYTIKTVNQLKWESFTALANGAAITVVDQPFYDGRLNKLVYSRLTEVFNEVKSKEALFGGVPIKHVALYYSVKTRDYYGREKRERYLLSINGAFKALLESQISVDFLFDENIDKKKLADYPVVFLANTAILNKKEIELFRTYVEAGGVLLTTHDTSLYDRYGKQIENFGLHDLFGVNFQKKTETEYNYIRLSCTMFNEDIDPDYDILCSGPGNIVETTHAQGIGELKISFFDRTKNRFFSHGMHPPYKYVGPAVTVNHVGKGKAVYVPFRLAASYAGEYMLPEHRLLIRNIIRVMGKQPVITVDASLNVESVITEQKDKNRFVIHFIAYNATKQSQTIKGTQEQMSQAVLRDSICPLLMIEEPPLYKIKVKINIPYSKVKFSEQDVQIIIKGNTIELLCNRIYEYLIIEK